MMTHLTIIGISLLIVIISYYFRFLSLSGSLATFILAEILLEAGGIKFIYPILSFFLLSSILSKISKKYFSFGDEILEKGSRRDHLQVIANGGFPGMIVLSGLLLNIEVYNLYLVSLAAAAADTWSTEIGLIYGRNPVRITEPWKPIQKGMSGGVSWQGFSGGILGSFSVAVFNLTQNQSTILSMSFIVLFGFLGTILDSYIGATVQGLYDCHECGKRTERKIHCNKKTNLIKGYGFITNDVVNILSPALSTLFYVLVI
jgi:uncharacterized protein (TIGR00297 family)